MRRWPGPGSAKDLSFAEGKIRGTHPVSTTWGLVVYIKLHWFFGMFYSFFEMHVKVTCKSEATSRLFPSKKPSRYWIAVWIFMICLVWLWLFSVLHIFHKCWCTKEEVLENNQRCTSASPATHGENSPSEPIARQHFTTMSYVQWC